MKNKLYETLINLQCELVAERNLVNPEQISWLQYDILTVLQCQASRPTDLSKRLGITQVKLSKNLKKLRDLDYIRQSTALKDRREVDTEITPKGRQFMIEIANKHDELFQTTERVLTKEEQEYFMVAANKLITELRNERMANGK